MGCIRGSVTATNVWHAHGCSRGHVFEQHVLRRLSGSSRDGRSDMAALRLAMPPENAPCHQHLDAPARACGENSMSSEFPVGPSLRVSNEGCTTYTARPAAATKDTVLHGFAGNSFTGPAYARLACRAPSRGAATSCSLGRQPQGFDGPSLSSPGGAMSRSRRGPPANVTRVPTSPRWGIAGRAGQDPGARAPG